MAQAAYYKYLDGLRAIAALWVIVHHIFVFFDLRPALGALYLPISRFAKVGVFGVDMFFVISGFLITGLLLEDIENSQIRVRRFYFRRFLKIVPQYLLTVAAGLLLELKYGWLWDQPGSPHPLERIWINLVFIQNYFSLLQIPPLAHLWTIAVEEQFYLIYPLLLLLLCSICKTFYERRIILMVVCLLLILNENVCRYAQIAQVLRGNGLFYFQETHFHFDGLVLGVFLKSIEIELRTMNGLARTIVSLSCMAWGCIIYSFFVVKGVHNLFWPTLGLACLAPGLLIASLLIDENMFMRRFLENSGLRWIGKCSYGIYLWHYIVLFFFYAHFKQPFGLGIVVVYVVVTIFIGFLSTVTIERYFLNLRKIVDYGFP